MTEKSKGLPGHHSNMKPVPMKLFSSWEVDRTPPNCIPRLCSLTLIKLVVMRPLPTAEVSSLIIAVKMAGSRRTLRSNEIPLLDNGLVNTDLELHFSLQYPHFLKRDENRLLISLQRRKKYKNRTILGYKTLAEGTVDMALVLQRTVDMDLCLFAPDGGNKENNGPIARVTIMGISSQPVDDLEGDRKGKQASGLRRQLSSPSPLNPNPNPGETTAGSKGRPRHNLDFSDDEDDFSSHSSDSPPDPEVILRKNSKSSLPHNRNLKQKIVNLLRKFKATEEGDRNEAKAGGPVADIDELFDELDGLSDSEPDVDTLSISSFPKPVLPPFFSSSRSLVQHNSIPERLTSDEKENSDSWEAEQFSGESPKVPLRSPGTSPSVVATPVSAHGSLTRAKLGSVAEQIPRVLPPEEGFPDLLALVSMEGQGPSIVGALSACGIKVLGVEGEGDIKATFPHLVAKFQKFCNNNAKAPPPLTLAVVGNEGLLSAVTKVYVNQLSSRPHDWQNYFSFLFVPFTTGGGIWRYLCHSDSTYAQHFNESLDRIEGEDLAMRIQSYSKACEKRTVLNLPIAEAMITYKDAEGSSQVFVPFISEVKLKSVQSHHHNMMGVSVEGGGEQQANESFSSPPSPPLTPREEPHELQVDYWKGAVKSSTKAIFRTLVINRTADAALAVNYSLKEQKKQKIMRLGKKKEKEAENKNLSLDGISRLVCLSKSQTPIKLYVDGVEWSGVKFFQVSAQWQSQVKNLPLLVSNQKSDGG